MEFSQVSASLRLSLYWAFRTEPRAVIVVCVDGSYYQFLFNPKEESFQAVCVPFL